jgi:hypothetical protein
VQISGDEAMRYDHFSMLPERAFQRRGGFGSAPATLEGGGKGGGGAAPPPPDPNIGIAQRELAQISREQLNTFKNDVWPEMRRQAQVQEARANEEFALFKSIQDEQLGIARAEYKRRQEVFQPIEDMMAEEARRYSVGGEAERQAALAVGDVRGAFARADKETAMQARSFGIDPTSGRYRGMNEANQVQEAAIAAAASNRARTAAEQLGWAKKADVVAMGANQFTNQATATGMAMNAGTGAINIGQTPIQNTAMRGASTTSGYGGAAQGWGSVGQLGVGSYNAQISAYNAQQQARAQEAAGWGSLVGSGIGAYAALSDRSAKKNIVAVGKLDNGLNLYSFEYLDSLQDEFGRGKQIGVMADEVEKVVPKAVFTLPNGYKAVNYKMVI